MMKKDFSDGFFKTENSSENKQNQTDMNGNLKRSKASILMLFVALFSFAYSFGQTTLISPTGDGGFENGATLAANGWTAVNAATDGWNVGNAPVSATGSNCGYVSANGGAAWTYSQTGTVTHIYRDFTIPAGESSLTLSFKWKAKGEGTTTSDWDNMKVFIASNTYTPTTTAVAGQTQISGSGSISGMYKLNNTSWNSETIKFTGTPGTTYRLIFSWKSDVSTIANPPAALDDISLISITPFISIASGNWNAPTTWISGTVPTCADEVLIDNGHDVTVNSAGNISKNLTILTGGTLTVASGVVTVGCTNNNNPLVNNGTLTVSGGTLNVNGNMLHNAASIFNQSGGNIVVDGNANGNAANSVASGTALIQLNSELINWTGGTLTVVDQHASTTATNTIGFSTGNGDVNVPNTHTLMLGNGVSTDGGGNTANGFRLNTWISSSRILFGNLVVNTLGGTTRRITTQYTLGFSGNMTIEPSSEVLFGTSYVAGNIVNNGIFTSTSSFYLADYLNGVNTATSNAQTISGSGIFRNSSTTVTANFNSLIVNNANATGVTLNVPLSVSGTLTMTSGIINTTNTNLLRLGTATATGTLSGTPSATNMIKGPFARTIANSNSAFIIFPVGKSTYSPISLAPTTTAVSVMKAEAFDSNTGSADATITNLSSTRRWEASKVSGNFTDIQVRLGDALIGASNIPVQAPTAAGIYTSAFGSVATYVAGTPNTTQSNTAVASADFTGFLSFADAGLCSGTPAPGNTTATASSICLGESVTFDIQNVPSGSGITYQWKSSADGVTYTAIPGETNQSLTITPTANFYLVDVTCAAGPVTGTSTSVQINYAGSITASTSAARCGTGTVVLTATPSAGATVNWYENPMGGSPVGTGSNFTTPSITATTTYYVAADAVSLGSIVLGTGANTSASAGSSFLPGVWGGAKTQYIIKASELAASGLSAGPISSLGFETTNSGQTYTGFNVYVGSTANTVAPSTTFIDNAGLTKVYGGTLADEGYLPVANTLNTLTFGTGAGASSSFNWDGSSNIVVSISWSSVPNASTASSTTMLVDNVGFVSTAYKQRDNTAPAVMLAETSVGYTGSNRPRFTINGQVVCQSPRTEVVATVTAPPAITLSSASEAICAGQSTPTVTLTAGSTDYDTYTWSPATGVTGDEVSGYVFNPAATTTYTLTATQTAGSLCATTVDFLVNVNALPSALTVTPAPASICVDEIQSLSASGGATSNVVILNEDFNGATNAWTTVNNSTGGTPANAAWTLQNSGYDYSFYGIFSSNDASQFYLTNSDYQGSGASANTELISPSFATTNFTDATVSFWHYFRQSGSAKVQYTIDGGTTWVDIQTYTSTTGTMTAFTQANLTLPAGALNQANVKIRFKYESGWQYFWAVDNVAIQGTQTTNITWSPVTDLYTDAAATVAYVGGAHAATVYVKSATAATTAYTVSATNPVTSCASTANVTVTVTGNTFNSTPVTACDTYTWAANGTTYTTSGTYTSVTGCHTEELVLTITPSTTNTTTESVCDTYTWAVNGTTYTTSGTYTVVTGCHTEELVLTVTPTSTNTTTEVACDSYTWAVNGTTYTTSGTYTSVTGCITEELILTITPSTTNTTTESVCDTYTWTANGTTYTTSGTYTVVTGCHTEELILTVTPTSTNTTTEVACDTYTWAVNGTVYTTSGTYTVVTGCVTEELILTITPSSTNTTTEVACGTYTWPVNGTVYTASGTYTVVTGCVSEILNLTITPVTTNTTTEVACDTYTWTVNGTTYTTSGTYTSVVGCVTETLNLTVNASPVTTITRTGDDLTADEAGATSYVWGRCDGPFTPIAGATNQSYKPTMVGKYAVRIIKNGCEVTSECVDVTTLDVKALDVANLNLYPNPVTNALTVTYTKNITGVQVYDMTGRLLKNIVTNTNEVSVDMSEMPASIYIVKVIAENTFSEFKVVKN